MFCKRHLSKATGTGTKCLFGFSREDFPSAARSREGEMQDSLGRGVHAVSSGGAGCTGSAFSPVRRAGAVAGGAGGRGSGLASGCAWRAQGAEARGAGTSSRSALLRGLSLVVEAGCPSGP